MSKDLKTLITNDAVQMWLEQEREHIRQQMRDGAKFYNATSVTEESDPGQELTRPEDVMRARMRADHIVMVEESPFMKITILEQPTAAKALVSMCQEGAELKRRLMTETPCRCAGRVKSEFADRDFAQGRPVGPCVRCLLDTFLRRVLDLMQKLD